MPRRTQPDLRRLDAFEAVIFDLDGVVTRTAAVHAAAWKAMFDDLLRRREATQGGSFQPFDADRDYRALVDGKPRYEGVQSFLDARGIALPYGDPADGPDRDTVCGLGNRKNTLFLDLLRAQGVEVYESTVALIHALKQRKIKVGVVSASKSCRAILEAVDLGDLFDVRVDGVEASRRGLPGKPAPDTFLEAVARLGVPATRAVVIEDAQAGVEAGRRGGFGLVIGVDRAGNAAALYRHGADRVIEDLAELALDGSTTTVMNLPSALERLGEITCRLEGRTPVLFLDYDGTLTPIVSRPEDALLSEAMRARVRRLVSLCPVAIVSGRDRRTVERFVGLDGLYYLGSHGFDILGPPGSGIRREVGVEFLEALDRAEAQVRGRVADIDGADAERKRFSLAVHYRRVAPAERGQVAAVVDAVIRAQPRLRKEGGKAVFEVRPDLEWDKGQAELWLMGALRVSHPMGIHIGDDLTDETAFRVLSDRGIGIVVADADKPTAARFVLRDPDEVGIFLDGLADAMPRLS